MNLLLLNGPSYPNPKRNPHYRGTDRAHPTYWDSLPKDHEINRLFFWFLEEGGEAGVVHDQKKSKRYVEILNAHSKDRLFDLVEVTDGITPSVCGGHFLGFDISFFYSSSLLVDGFESPPGLSALPAAIHNLCDLLNRHYRPQLNSSGLFQSHEAATSCLQSMIALQTLSPNLFEGDNLNRFGVNGIFLLEETRVFLP